MMHGAAAQEWNVEGLAVVGDQKVVLADDPLHLGDHRALLGVVAGEELTEDEIAIADVTETDQEHGRGLKAACLDVQEEHAAVAEFPEEPALGWIERRDGFGQGTWSVAWRRTRLVGRHVLSEHG